MTIIETAEAEIAEAKAAVAKVENAAKADYAAIRDKALSEWHAASAELARARADAVRLLSHGVAIAAFGACMALAAYLGHAL